MLCLLFCVVHKKKANELSFCFWSQTKINYSIYYKILLLEKIYALCF